MADDVEATIAAVLAAVPRGDHCAALCAKADSLLAAGDLETALACFDRALRVDVSRSSAWVGRAIILSARKRDSEALGCIDRALDVDPSCARALLQKGHILRGRGLHQEALAAYESALGASPSDEARVGRSAALNALGRSEEVRPAPPRSARKSLRRSVRADPRAEKPSERRVAAKKVSGMSHPAPVTKRRSQRGGPLESKKNVPVIDPTPLPPRRPDSRPSAQLPVAAPPVAQEDQDLATLDEVRALCLAGRHVEALRLLEPIAKRTPGAREAWTLRAQILFFLEEFDAALSSVERVAKVEPHDQDALKLMVRVLAAMGRDVRALEAAERLLLIAPRDVDVHRLRADCLVASMRHAEAVVAYEKVIHYLPEDARAWLALGRTLRQLRRVAEARMSLTKGLALAEFSGAADLAAQAQELLAKLPPEGG